MSDHEARISKLEQARHEIEDALLVMAHLETRQSQHVRELAENAESDRARLARIEREEEAHRRMNQETDERIAKLVSAIGELIARMPQPK